MTVIFRVDQSSEIGTGHLMRCLALADGFKQHGFDSHFVCRQISSHFQNHIQQRGYYLHLLTGSSPNARVKQIDPLAHAAWLLGEQQDDARECLQAIEGLGARWVVVDHYGIDSRWESMVKECGYYILVIDDLADRTHLADIVIDQTYGRVESNYAELVGDECRLLLGCRYALLRSEFLSIRDKSAERRAIPRLEKVLINFGGVDAKGLTLAAVRALHESPLARKLKFTVVMGGDSCGVKEVQSLLGAWGKEGQLLINASNMAELMCGSDLAIGAAGSTSWERCCLGLPSIIMVTADNQKLIASNLAGASISQLAFSNSDVIHYVERYYNWAKLYSDNSFNLVDGKGVSRVIEEVSRI